MRATTHLAKLQPNALTLPTRQTPHHLASASPTTQHPHAPKKSLKNTLTCKLKIAADYILGATRPAPYLNKKTPQRILAPQGHRKSMCKF